MNEGCDGGWGIFNGYFSEKGHMVTEECAPYKGRTKGDTCSNYASCPGFAKVKSSYYVGGYNFNPDYKLIQKEMLMHGPVVTEFLADDNFQLYKEGILSQSVIPPQPKNEEALMVPITGSVEFVQLDAQTKVEMSNQQLDHTIFLVGWGYDKDKQMPYWIVRNSYGDQWG